MSCAEAKQSSLQSLPQLTLSCWASRMRRMMYACQARQKGPVSIQPKPMTTGLNKSLPYPEWAPTAQLIWGDTSSCSLFACLLWAAVSTIGAQTINQQVGSVLTSGLPKSTEQQTFQNLSAGPADKCDKPCTGLLPFWWVLMMCGLITCLHTRSHSPLWPMSLNSSLKKSKMPLCWWRHYTGETTAFRNAELAFLRHIQYWLAGKRKSSILQNKPTI